MAFDPTKYDIQLDGQGYRIRSLSRDSAPDFISRFNTGAEGETDLDLLKTVTYSMHGGMFQEHALDLNMVKSIENGFINPIDLRLYAARENDETTPASDLEGDYYINYKSIEYEGTMLVSYFDADASGDVHIDDVSTSAVTNLVLPAALRDHSTAISDMTWFGGNVVIASPGLEMYQYNGSTFSVFSAGAHAMQAVENHGGTLYGITVLGSFQVYNSTEDTFTEIANVDESFANQYELISWNHRLWIRANGNLYLFDGVNVVKVLDFQWNDGINWMAQLNGWLYMIVGSTKMYRFNGSTLEKILDLVDTQMWGLAASDTRVFMIATNGTGAWWEHLGGDYSIYSYDEVGWTCLNNTQTHTETFDHMFVYEDRLFTIYDGAVGVDSKAYIQHITYDHNGQTKDDMVIVTSEEDNDLPNVTKYLDTVEIDHEQIVSGDDIEVEYRTRSDNGSWSAWTSLGSITSTNTDSKLYAGITYKLIQLKVTVQTGTSSDLSLERISMHYSVMPDRRSRYNMMLICQGADKYNPQQLKDGALETADPKALREAVYQAEASKTPVIFLPPDYCKLDEGSGITDSATGTINVTGGTDTFPDSGHIYMGSEAIAYSSKTASTFVVSARGEFGTTATAHSDDAIVSAMKRVIVDQIIGENYIVTPNTDNTYRTEPDYGLESIINIQVTEVS